MDIVEHPIELPISIQDNINDHICPDFDLQVRPLPAHVCLQML